MSLWKASGVTYYSEAGRFMSDMNGKITKSGRQYVHSSIDDLIGLHANFGESLNDLKLSQLPRDII